MHKEDFKIFKNHPELIYLDNAASSQKPITVVNAVENFYSESYANVHRGSYSLSEKATQMYEDSREKVKNFINAKNSDQIIFTNGTTSGINMLAYSLETIIPENAIIVATKMDHHSNFIPWQQLAHRKHGQFKVVGLTTDYILDLNELYTLVEKSKPFIVALPHMSNVLGTINPVNEISSKIHSLSPKTIVVIDAAQSIAHIKIDVQRIGCDALVFSGHKMFGPSGIGILYLSETLVNDLNPSYFGGGMINKVEIEVSTWDTPPHKFEAGTPNIEGAIGLGAAVDYILNIGLKTLCDYEKNLTEYFMDNYRNINDIKLFGPNSLNNRGPVFSFILTGIHSHDLSELLNEDSIAVRSGHHCAQILHKDILKTPATTRVSLSIYNTKNDLDLLFKALNKARWTFTKKI